MRGDNGNNFNFQMRRKNHVAEDVVRSEILECHLLKRIRGVLLFFSRYDGLSKLSPQAV